MADIHPFVSIPRNPIDWFNNEGGVKEIIYLESLMSDLAAWVTTDSLLQAEHDLTFTQGPSFDTSKAHNCRPVAGNQF